MILSMKTFKKFLPHILIVLFILLAVGLTWDNLKLISINGDGFVYIIHRFSATFPRSTAGLFMLENSSFLMNLIFVPWFGANLHSYLKLEFIIILIIAILFYITVYTVTKSKFIAFSATLIQSLSYLGNWSMYTGWYAYIFERLPSMLILLPSFILLHKYLVNNKIKILLLSVLIYLFGVGLWHWGLLLTGLFASYPFFYGIFYKRKKMIIYVLISLFFVIISQFFVLMQSVYEPVYGGNNHSILRVILGNGKHEMEENISLVFRQLTYLSQYPQITNLFISRLFTYPQILFDNSLALYSNFSYRFAKDTQPLIIIMYIFITIFTYFTLPKFRALLSTMIFATLSTFYLNLYIGQYRVEDQSGSNRYLFLPGFTLAIFWALFLYALIKIFKKIGLTVVLFCLVSYMFINVLVIKNNFFHIMPTHNKITATFDYIINNQQRLFNQEAIILLGVGLGGYEAEFLNDHFGNGKTKYYSQEDYALPLIPKDTKKIMIGYDNKCQCVKEIKIND